MSELLAFILYFSVLIGYALAKKKRALTQTDFVIGNRSLGSWTTAMAAHASDMSNWIFMAYPGAVFVSGGSHVWTAIGLLTMMWINWTVVAPQVRRETEKTGSVTITEFFEKKLGKNWPQGRLVTSLSLFIFYTVYVSVTLCGMGLLLQTLFGISYGMGVLLGVAIIIPYVLIGGYLTLAQVDLFQGLFLLGVILFVPLYALKQFGGVGSTLAAIAESGKSLSLFSEGSWGLAKSFLLMFGWGLGYFGQPHILTKFMGIKLPSQISQAKRIGMSWQALSMLAATLIGFVGIAVIKELGDPEQVFIVLVRQYFSPFVSGIFLCAVVAAIINAVSSMLLVLSTTLAEDVYKRFIRKESSSKELLFVTRLAGALSALVGLGIALLKIATIDQLVLYAWSGLGATFGPLMIASLYFKRLSPTGAWVGMVVGATTVVLWPILQLKVDEFPPLIIGFPLALTSIYLVSKRSEISRLIKN